MEFRLQERLRCTAGNIIYKVAGNIAAFEKPQKEERKSLDPHGRTKAMKEEIITNKYTICLT